MKKKNLIILLLIPFIIALLGIITINASFNTFYGDITSIEWEYEDQEAFNLNASRYILRAQAKNSNNSPLDDGNQLVWRVENKDKNIIDPIAKIVVENGISYLVPLGDGEVIITCSNLKGNVSKRMTAIIYSDGAIVITPAIKGSGSNIDNNIYYGEYDLKGSNKLPASFKLKYKCIPEELNSNLKINSSDNINAKIENNEIVVNIINSNESKEAYIELSANEIKQRYDFIAVDEGVNCYSYDDLLECTNKSANGEIVVLRKSLESLANYNSSDKNNVSLFGHYNSSTKSFTFKDEVYRFETTYNHEYIDQWNEFTRTNKDYKSINKEVLAGLRVQKDFYGNGYTINMHNLTYPSMITEVNKAGEVVEVPTLAKDDLFRGPKELYTLGDPNNMPLITAYGQDNSGIYMDGDNITINDINIRNCDMGQSLSFLNTVGSVVDVLGDNNTIKNSRLSNGKNVLRSFSSNNLTVDNSLLSNSLNFLISTGSNEYIKYDELSKFELKGYDGTPYSLSLTEFLGKEKPGDEALNTFLHGTYKDINLMKESLMSIQRALNPVEGVLDKFHGSMAVNDTYLYHSGLSAISFETLFNGPFLYSKSPSLIEDIFSSVSMGGKPVAPFIPSKVTGLSYPVSVDLTGNTRFYDYKDPNNIDLAGLINENISKIASEVAGSDKNITIDDVFPVKRLLIKEGSKPTSNTLINNEMNIVAAFYGGATNLSKLSIDGVEKGFRTKSLEINFLDEYLRLQANSDSLTGIMRDVMVKCVTVVTGFEPFEFVCVEGGGYLANESPNIDDLIQNAKGVQVK